MSDLPSIPESSRHADFVRLFVEDERRIYAYIRSLVPNRADAENLLQETTLVLWEKFDQFEPGSDFVRWALTIARFKALNYHKQRKRDSIVFSEPLLEAIDEVSTKLASDPVDLRQVLEDCLKKLSVSDRDVFRRRFLPGTSVPQLANELGRPVTTVYHALDRIRRALVACVERQLQGREH
jgi:RNA polymerase sigma-70 factor, ECF subfamily